MDQKKNFEVGEVVMLNSETITNPSVVMTVTEATDTIGFTECSWFSGGVVMSHRLPAEALTKVPLL